jgi:DNA ligase-1
VSCDAIEARYLMRSLAGKLRNGLGEQSILASLGHAFATTHVSLEDGETIIIDKFEKMRKNDQIEEIKKKLEGPVQMVKQSYYQCPNYDMLIQAILKHGLNELDKHCKLMPGIPLKPMLAYPTKGIHEVLKRFDNALLTCEYKYDGERAQIHIMEDGNIKIYSRNSENNTSKYPDIIEFLKDLLKLKPTSKSSVKDEKKIVKKDNEVEKEDEDESSDNLKVTSAIVDAEVII